MEKLDLFSVKRNIAFLFPDYLPYFLSILLLGFTYQLSAQTVIISDDFENWNGNLNCPLGWNCSTSSGCINQACSWGRNDLFGTNGQPSQNGCNGSGYYARCQTSQLNNGEVPTLITPTIDLSAFSINASIDFSFCLINPSSNPSEDDGITIAYSNDNGLTWLNQLQIDTIFSTWTNVNIAIPAPFRTASFKIKIEGRGNNSSTDIGIDDLAILDNSIICGASSSVISSGGIDHICKDALSDLITLTHNNNAGNYDFILTDLDGVIIKVLPSNTFDFNELEANKYKVYGVNYIGELTADKASSISNISASGCHVFSSNILNFNVRELEISSTIISDYHGFPISKAGGNDGIAKVAVKGETGNFSYHWNTHPAQLTQIATNLEANTYQVLISDSLGCQVEVSITLTQPFPVRGEFEVASPISCYGEEDGVLSVQGNGGVAPYTYSWHQLSQNQGTQSGLGKGDYSVTITDLNGAEYVIDYSLLEPDSLLANFDFESPSCFGADNGSIRISPTGGTAPYSFDWNNGSKTAEILNLSAGDYTCQITDQNGCIVPISTELTQPDSFKIEATIFHNECFTDQNGFISLEVEGGKTPYKFIWDHGETGTEALGLSVGNYEVLISDDNDCQTRIPFTIESPSPIEIGGQTIADNGLSVGQIFANASGGTSGYLFQWNTGDTSAILEGLAMGTYTLTVTDGNGCSAEKDFLIEATDKLNCLSVHTGFSPNGDGINEAWHIPCLDLFPNLELTIFNRWGQELFYTTHYDNSWNGTSNGRPLPDGTYFYLVKVKDAIGNRQIKGTVTIIR